MPNPSTISTRTSAARAERQQKVARFEKVATRIAVGLAIAGPILGIVAGMLGAAEVYPYDYALPVALGVMGGCIGVALLIGACGGLYVMAGPWAAPLGVVFVAGFGALVVGIAASDATFRDLGAVLLGASGGIFYAVGVVSGGAPGAAVATWGTAGSVAGGVVLAVVGRAWGAWPVLLFGAMAAGCGIGGMAGRWWVRRRAAASPDVAASER